VVIFGLNGVLHLPAMAIIIIDFHRNSDDELMIIIVFTTTSKARVKKGCLRAKRSVS
jgi:hypothetical protein